MVDDKVEMARVDVFMSLRAFPYICPEACTFIQIYPDLQGHGQPPYMVFFTELARCSTSAPSPSKFVHSWRADKSECRHLESVNEHPAARCQEYMVLVVLIRIFVGSESSDRISCLAVQMSACITRTHSGVGMFADPRTDMHGREMDSG